MLRSLTLILLVVGCASGKRAPRCAPLPTEYQAYSPLYRECAVDVRARLLTDPNFRGDMTKLEPLITSSPSSTGCYEAVYQFVVDEKGYPNVASAILVRTNSRSYANAVRDEIATMKFDPAKKDGSVVRQLYEHTWKLQYAMSRNGTRPTRRPPPC